MQDDHQTNVFLSLRVKCCLNLPCLPTYMYNLFLFLFLFFQTHPNIDKKVFSQGSVLALKQPNKPFPLNSDIGVLRWRMQTTDEALMPLSSTFLPKKNAFI